MVNSDNLELTETMKNGGHFAGNATTIIDDCYHLACEFRYITLGFCPREANTVAHELTKLDRFSFCNEWFEDASIELLPLLMKDVNLITS